MTNNIIGIVLLGANHSMENRQIISLYLHNVGIPESRQYSKQSDIQSK